MITQQEQLSPALEAALARQDWKQIRTIFSFQREALARAEAQRDAFLLEWNRASASAVQSTVKVTEPVQKAIPKALRKEIETEEDLGL